MRDLLVTAVIFGLLPLILYRPFLGVLAWAWVGYMNPHRLTWGFAYDMPFAQLIAIATLVGLVVTRNRRAIPFTGTTLVWIALALWMTVTTVFAIFPEYAQAEWDRTMKIQLLSFVTIILTCTRMQINSLVAVIALSLGFYGVKGGIFAVATGGNYRVYGPPESFIGDNNSIALALIMALPLLRYLQMNAPTRAIRMCFLGAIPLTALAILATHSRGALVAMIVTLFVLAWKSRGKLWLLLILPIAIPLMWSFMPEHWHERMEGITRYEQDSSAMGRVNAWWFAWRLALDRPLLGGGFDTFDPYLFRIYAPDPTDFHDSHSIYFEMLAEHGFVGLGLYLLLGILAFRTASEIIRATRESEETLWARDLAAMVQVSIVGYATGGAFLGLAYFDLYYHLLAILVVLKRLLQEDEAEEVDATLAGEMTTDGELDRGSVGAVRKSISVPTSLRERAGGER